MLEIDTKKGLYKPIEVKIDGEIYQTREINREVIAQIKKIAQEALEGDIEAGYRQLEYLFEKPEITDKLDIRIVNLIIEEITDKIFVPEKFLTEQEKNGSRPGPTK